MNIAIIKAGVVVNVIVADQAFIAQYGAQLGGDQLIELTPLNAVRGQRAGPGWTWNGTAFAPPAGA